MSKKPISRTRKFLFVAAIVLLLLCLIATAFALLYSTDAAIQLQLGTCYNPANYKQYDCALLGEINGKLYMSNGPILYSFEDGKFQRVRTCDGLGIAMYDGRYFYSKDSWSMVFQNNPTGFFGLASFLKLSNDTQTEIYAYDPESGQTVCVSTVQSELWQNLDRFIVDEKIHVAADYDRTTYYVFDRYGTSELTQERESFTFGTDRYTKEISGAQEILVKYSADGTRTVLDDILPGSSDLVLIPCEKGLLVENKGQEDVLYFLDWQTGNLVNLFSLDSDFSDLSGPTTSAVNVWGDYAYLSVYHQVQVDYLAFSREYDERNGTYRICLADYSVEKISDEVYDGLYIFDGTGIYACLRENSRIYKLDFDGNAIFRLS